MSRKLASILAAAIILAALVPSARLAWRFRAMPQMGAYHDDALYLESAKSLADRSVNSHNLRSVRSALDAFAEVDFKLKSATM